MAMCQRFDLAFTSQLGEVGEVGEVGEMESSVISEP